MHHMVTRVGVFVDVCVLKIPHVLGISISRTHVLIIVDAALKFQMHVSSGPTSGVQSGVQI
jgi:hypothetical protein